MIGQGSPSPVRLRCASTAPALVAGWGMVFLGMLVAAVEPSFAAEASMRIRIAWGGGSERLWQGTISVSQGSLAEPTPLGIEADEPGSMWLEGGQLVIRQRSPRAYDGLDLLALAPPDAQLVLQLAAADDPANPVRVEIPLAPLLDQFQNTELDDRGNRLLVCRAPGDALRVSLAHSSLVFAPGEALKFDLQPCLPPGPSAGKTRIKIDLVAAGSAHVIWSVQHEVPVASTEAIPVQIPLPKDEGVYEAVVAASPAPNWQQAVRQPLQWKRSTIERSVQVVVLDSARRQRHPSSDRDLATVVEIDPSNPRWAELLARLPKLPRMPRFWKGPLGNGNLQVIRHPLGPLVQLNPNSRTSDASWEIYTLPISRPGLPHVLEIEYPSDQPQTLGITVLEPNAAGALMPVGLDSGVDVEEPLAVEGSSPRWARHRLVFWPRTESPLVLMTNRHEHRPAVYGKIRVLAGWEHLPRASTADDPGPQRLLAAHLDRPMFPENFSAEESLDGWSNRSLDDWRTFYQGGQRLVEYLQYVGYNGLILSVLADGSTIYPSKLLEPTPRYDTGTFFANAQDPLRKDVLEMLFRLFDREKLQLVPAVEFATPLPQLESLRRYGGTESEGLEWIGPDGVPWGQVHGARRGLAPYYNVLDPRVQEAMLAVVRELARRYGQHRSFAGLAVQLAAHGYAQLPGPDWGLDDATMARFQRDARLRLPGEGPSRFAHRAEMLRREEYRHTWMEWRASRLTQFYRQLQAEVNAVRPGSRLYLLGGGTFTGTELESDLRPALPQRATAAEALLRVGISPQHYEADANLVLLRPERLAPSSRLGAQAVSLELHQMPDIDRQFQALAVPGSVFFHQPQELRVPSLDEKIPLRPSYTWLVPSVVPSGEQNRRRFIRSLASLDAQVIADGGWLLPMGQEDGLREVTAAYRRLPPVRMARVEPPRAETTSQPVTFRYGTHAGRTYVYAVNESPFPAMARVWIDASAECRLEELTGARRVAPLVRDVEGTSWTIELLPYDLIAAELSEPGVKFSRPEVVLPGTAEAALEQRIRHLSARAAALRNPPPLRALGNPGFERAAPPVERLAVGEEQILDWVATKRPGVTIHIDKSQRHSGSRSAKVTSTGPVACLVSRPLAAPTTGRLSMSVWLRVADVTRQPPLRLAIEGKLDGRDYYRYAQVGQPAEGSSAAVPIGDAWGEYIFQVDDMPLEGLAQLRVRFDLMGPGEVWIDDLQLFDLVFNKRELIELSKLITLADVKRQQHQVGDCLRLLEGYWPRFLAVNVPLSADAVPPAGLAHKPSASRNSRPPPEPPSPQSSLLNRVKNLLPERLRF